MQGVAYNAKILAVKAMDYSGSGDSSDIAAGIYYSTGHGAKVINLSLGIEATNTQIGTTTIVDPGATDITPAIQNAMSHGVVVFAAAGNSAGANPIFPCANSQYS